jgi:hypothetical protein
LVDVGVGKKVEEYLLEKRYDTFRCLGSTTLVRLTQLHLGRIILLRIIFYSEKIAIEIILARRDSERQELGEIKKHAAGISEPVLNQQ